MRVLWHLFSLEISRQWRQPRGWATLFLFVFSAMMVLYFGFNRMIKETWTVMFWVILLFGGITSAVGEDHLSGKQERFLYVQWASAYDVYMTKLIYQGLLLFIIASLQWGVMSLFFGSYLSLSGMNILLVAMGAFSLSIIFCFVSAVVGAAEKGTAMATLLGFPLVIPSLLLLIRMTYSRLGLVEAEFFNQDLVSLLGLDAVLLGIGLFLYPLIWKS